MSNKQVIRQLQNQVNDLQRGNKSRGSQLVRAASIPAGGEGAAGTEFITFEITDIIRGVGFYCNAVTATVLSISCNATGVVVGDEVIIWDGLLCSFNLPMELLIGVQGYAIRMTTGNDYYDGGAEPERPCRWEVLRMCCVEENTP